ncbi:MAG: hypothetical protein U9P14_00535 [Gemmatimonadota bacterium]|nr:hypothetical protein [Gemmatimonadota bacterium]
MRKKDIHDQIKLHRLNMLIAEAEELDLCSKMLAEIRKGNYKGLAALSREYRISFAPLYSILESRAGGLLGVDSMPKSCEIAVLELMLSPRAEEMNLHNLSTKKELEDSDLLEIFFLLFAHQLKDDDLERLNELLDTCGLKKLHDYIWGQGLIRFFNKRYRVLKDPPKKELSVIQAAESLGLPEVLEEDKIVKRYIELGMNKEYTGRDIKQKLFMENTLRAEAMEKVQEVYKLFEKYPCDFNELEAVLLELHMDLEVIRIQQYGISLLKDYIRSKAIIGADVVARNYDFIRPAVSRDDMPRARRYIRESYLSQARKTRKGKVFLRREALYNLNSGVHSFQCFRLPSGYLLCVIGTGDQGEHYLFGQYQSRSEQELFIQGCLGNFLTSPVYQRAVSLMVRKYITALAEGIRMANAFRKILVSMPLALILSVMVGVLYSIALGGVMQSLVVGGGILFIGVAISGKNGYDEDITPASHEKIPDYINLHQGQIKFTSAVKPLSTGGKQ